MSGKINQNSSRKFDYVDNVFHWKFMWQMVASVSIDGYRFNEQFKWNSDYFWRWFELMTGFFPSLSSFSPFFASIHCCLSQRFQRKTLIRTVADYFDMNASSMFHQVSYANIRLNGAFHDHLFVAVLCLRANYVHLKNTKHTTIDKRLFALLVACSNRKLLLFFTFIVFFIMFQLQSYIWTDICAIFESAATHVPQNTNKFVIRQVDRYVNPKH